MVMCVCVCVCVCVFLQFIKCGSEFQIFHLHFTAELGENSALNTKVWEAAGLRGNGTFPLDYFSYNNSALLDVIFRHVQRTNFSGVTVSEGVMFAVILVTVEIYT